MTVSIVIPACNEEKRIKAVLLCVSSYADEIIVIDDGSVDNTGLVALTTGAKVVQQNKSGYISAIKRGFREATGTIIVTMDADGEHPAQYIPQLIAPIESDQADLVMGSRPFLPRISEYLLSWLTRSKIRLTDPCTGFRAIKKDLAQRLTLDGYCTCGLFALEALYLGARITEVAIVTPPINKKRSIAWGHFKQILVIFSWLLKLSKRDRKKQEVV